MGQTVSDIMTTDVVSLSAEHSVRDAARRMREANVGAILVQTHGNLFGIITDRDIVVRCLAHGGDCDDTPLSEICSSDVTTLGPDDEVDRAVTLMRDKAIRRIPVVKNGKPVGILSLGDLALQRDPFSALGAISMASPNNEIRGNEIRGNEIRGNEIRGNEIRGNEIRDHEIRDHEMRDHELGGDEARDRATPDREVPSSDRPTSERANNDRSASERPMSERPTVARTTPTMRLAAARR